MPVIMSAAARSPAPSVFVVNSPGDHDDGSCDGSDCTLREALIASNNNPGPDTIRFNIAGAGTHTISPKAELPEVTDAVTIDGSSQAGFSGLPLIEIVGTGILPGRGLIISAGGSTVRSLAINRFSSAQVLLKSGGGNVLQGNRLGTDPTGTMDYREEIHARYSFGLIVEGSNSNLIGGPDRKAGNIIAFNTSAGILVTDLQGGGVENAILSNSIHSNGGIGIDLSGLSQAEPIRAGFPLGVTANDGCDGDGGPNRLQNFPELNLARTNGVAITIRGEITTARDTTYTIQFFSNDEFDLTGFGEGRTYLGSTTATTDQIEHECIAEYEATLPFFAYTGQVITATATDPLGNTSEFSRYLEIVQDSTFDSCVQDDSSGSVFLFDSNSGEYQFSNCDGFLLSGTGTMTRKGGVITLQHNASDRRIMARLDSAVKRGTAWIQSFAEGAGFGIVDKNTGDNTCACGER